MLTYGCPVTDNTYHPEGVQCVGRAKDFISARIDFGFIAHLKSNSVIQAGLLLSLRKINLLSFGFPEAWVKLYQTTAHDTRQLFRVSACGAPWVKFHKVHELREVPTDGSVYHHNGWLTYTVQVVDGQLVAKQSTWENAARRRELTTYYPDPDFNSDEWQLKIEPFITQGRDGKGQTHRVEFRNFQVN